MSTKATIAHGEKFHLYHDVGDANNIYLRLDQSSFDASPDQVTVTIPLHIWEFIIARKATVRERRIYEEETL